MDDLIFDGMSTDGQYIADDHYQTSFQATLIESGEEESIIEQEAVNGPEFVSLLNAGPLEERLETALDIIEGIADEVLYAPRKMREPLFGDASCTDQLLYQKQDDFGRVYTRKDQYCNGVKVFHGRVIYVTDGASVQPIETLDFRKTGIPGNLNFAPTLTPQQALNISSQSLSSQGAYITSPAAQLFIYQTQNGTFNLVYYISSSVAERSDSGTTQQFVDAHTGAIVDQNIDSVFVPVTPVGAGTNFSSLEDDPLAPSASKISRSGRILKYNGAPARFMGYSEFYAATKMGFLTESYFKNSKGKIPPPSTDKRHINLHRLFVFGHSGNAPNCQTNDCECPGDERMPFKYRGDQGGYQVYRSNGPEWDALYFQSLEKALQKAQAHGQVVQLTLFDGYWLQDLYSNSPWHPNRSTMPQCPAPSGQPCLPGGSRLDPIPEFYEIFGSTQNPDDLNALGLIERALVDKVMDIAKNYNNVFVEVMNEARYDPRGSAPPMNATLFGNWHRAVRAWTRLKAPGYQVSASVINGSLVGEPIDPYEAAVFTKVDVINLHWRHWKTSGANITTALTKFSQPPPGGFGKPVIIDTDGSGQRGDNNKVEQWASAVKVYADSNTGTSHFNHLDGMMKDSNNTICLDCNALQRLRDRLQTLVDYSSQTDGNVCP